MKSSNLQDRLSPPTQAESRNYLNSNPTKSSEETVPTAEKDFRSVLMNSQDDVKKSRDAKKNGDLTAGSDDEFFQKLEDQTKERRSPKNELGKDDFLKLFVTQLQNQDPLSPDDGAEMAAKLAQFNGLEQMMNMNTTLAKMVESQNSGRSLQLVNYIGKEVTLEGGRLQLAGGKFKEPNFDLKAPSARTTLQIRDGSGHTVFEKELGAQGQGQHRVEWDGKIANGAQAPDGAYTFSVAAKNSDGKDLPVVTQTTAKITGVDIKDLEGSLFTDLGKIKYSDVVSIGRPSVDAVEKAPKPAEKPADETTTAPALVSPASVTPAADAEVKTAHKALPAESPTSAPPVRASDAARASPPSSEKGERPRVATSA